MGPVSMHWLYAIIKDDRERVSLIRVHAVMHYVIMYYGETADENQKCFLAPSLSNLVLIHLLVSLSAMGMFFLPLTVC